MSDFIVNGGYQGDVSFYKQNGTVKRFNATPSKSNVGSIDRCLYGVVGLNDGNLQENYTAPYSQPVMRQPATLGGTSVANIGHQLRPRVVSYKLFFKTKSPKLTLNSTQYGMLGRGVKEYVQAFVREFLDVGDLKVQYGMWGGIDLGGYLVDAPQATYSPDGSQATLSFVLQFTNPITLHPNFTNSTIWNNTSTTGTQIDWATLTTEDSDRLKAATVTRDTTTGALKASFKNVKRWSNLAYLCKTAKSNISGVLTVKQSGNTTLYRRCQLSTVANRVTLFTTPYQSYYTVTEVNNANNINRWITSINYQAGVSAVPPTQTGETITVTFTPNTPADTSTQTNGVFMLMGW